MVSHGFIIIFPMRIAIFSGHPHVWTVPLMKPTFSYGKLLGKSGYHEPPGASRTTFLEDHPLAKPVEIR